MYPEGDYLDTVIKEHTDFIFATIKAALKAYPLPPSTEVLIQEKTQVRTNTNPLENIHLGHQLNNVLLTLNVYCTRVTISISDVHII